MRGELEALIGELDLTAAKLRAGELGSDEAADLVDRCAELAGRIGAELELLGRGAERDLPVGGQEQLL